MPWAHPASENWSTGPILPTFRLAPDQLETWHLPFRIPQTNTKKHPMQKHMVFFMVSQEQVLPAPVRMSTGHSLLRLFESF